MRMVKVGADCWLGRFVLNFIIMYLGWKNKKNLEASLAGFNSLVGAEPQALVDLFLWICYPKFKLLSYFSNSRVNSLSYLSSSVSNCSSSRVNNSSSRVNNLSYNRVNSSSVNSSSVLCRSLSSLLVLTRNKCQSCNSSDHQYQLFHFFDKI